MTAIVTRGNAADLHLPDETVDLVVTSPPYFGLRSYQDGGEHYAGQVGDEATPAEYLDALIACTAEWMRVLKPGGSIFVNLGDKYAGNGAPSRHGQGATGLQDFGPKTLRIGAGDKQIRRDMGVPTKSLTALPWRYAIRCIDELGLILRAEIVWAKPNGLPESVTDRVRRAHEQVFHFTKEPRYYSAVDEVREAHGSAVVVGRRLNGGAPLNGGGQRFGADGSRHTDAHPLGKLPGSVWEIPTAPLKVPASLGIDHFAAYPPELVRRIVLGWSPREVCTACGEGWRPVARETGRVVSSYAAPELGGTAANAYGTGAGRQDGETQRLRASNGHNMPKRERVPDGYACACLDDRERPEWFGTILETCVRDVARGRIAAHSAVTPELVAEWRRWNTPTTPGVVLDPFGGTGTTALVASAFGRVGISVDLSADYCRLAQWRTTDPGERARVLKVEKPPVQVDGQLGMFEGIGA